MVKAIKRLTTTINNITKFAQLLLSNGLACTINADPDIERIDDGKLLKLLLKVYFNLNGSHIQFNSISLSDLEEGQKHPENFQNFMVRVSRI